MYFIRINALKEKLRARAMTDREALPYYIIFMACISLTFLPMESQTRNIWNGLMSLNGILLTIAGVFYSYFKNGGRTGYDFIQKSVVLGWILTIRFMAIMISGVIGIGFIKASVGYPIQQTSWMDVIFVAAFEILYFQQLGRHLADTNDSANEFGQPQCPKTIATAFSGPLDATNKKKAMVHSQSWGGTLRVWWSLAWRTLLIVIPTGVVTAAVIFFILGFAGLSDEMILKFSNLIVWPIVILVIIISIIPVRIVLGKNFGRHRLLLIAENEKEQQ